MEGSIQLLDNDTVTQSPLENVALKMEALRLKRAAVNVIEAALPALRTPLKTAADSVNLIDRELNKRKKMYAKTVVSRYRNYKLLNNVFFLLRASSVSEFFKRMSYLRMIANYQKARVQVLTHDVNERNNIYRRYEAQANQWNHWRGLAERLNIEVKQDQQTLNQLVRRTARNPYAVNRHINQHNRRHWRYRKFLAEHVSLSLDAKDYHEQREVLPTWDWPLDTSVVLYNYGYRSMPKTRTARIMNKGLFLATTEGAPVQAVAAGVVLQVVERVPFGTTVLVQSGERVVIYGQLASSAVQAGDAVLPGHLVGHTKAESAGLSRCFIGVVVNNRLADPSDYLVTTKSNQN